MATQSGYSEITRGRFAALNDPAIQWFAREELDDPSAQFTDFDPSNPAINPGYTMPDVLAIAPYFGMAYTPSDLPPNAASYPSVDDVVGSVSQACIADSQRQVLAQKAFADRQGCPLVCYEGGQGFVGIWGAENDQTLHRHPYCRESRSEDV